jgi:hypothetical protein
MSDPRDDPLNQAIFRAVKGEKTWPLSPLYNSGGGTFKEEFEAGDKQMLLWAIVDSAWNNEPIPKWAADKFLTTVFSAAKGEFSSWDGAFGKLFERAYRTRIQEQARLMFPVGRRIQELSKQGQPIGDLMYEQVAEEFHIGTDRVRTYWRFYRDFIKG